MKKYDPEENFEIDLELAYKVDELHYHGVKTHYIEDTNTLIFSKDKEYENDSDDLDTIIYRNYDLNDIKQHIDFNYKKMMYDELEPMYSGYPTEDNYRKNLIDTINKTKLNKMKEISSRLEYSLSAYDLIRIAQEYKKNNKDFNEKAEYLLTDLNFHSECSMLIENDIDDLIKNCKKEIRKINEHYVLGKFVDKYKIDPASQGFISNNSKELNDVSTYDLSYLQYEGYIRPTLSGYELTDEYIKEIDSKERKYKYVHWLKVDVSNETDDGKEWNNLKQYEAKYDCKLDVFYYNNNFTSKIIKLSCDQSYNDLDLDVNSMSEGSLIRLKHKPKNITPYNQDIDYFYDKKISKDLLEKEESIEL